MMQDNESRESGLPVERATSHADLISAAQDGDMEDVRIFLEDPSTDVNKISEDDERKTALHCAAELGHIEVVGALLENPNVNVNQSDGKGRTPLDLAARKGHSEVVQLLLRNPNLLDVNRTDDLGFTPLYLAAWNGHSEVVQVLLGNPKVDVNSTNNLSNTTLMRACARGHVDIVRLLLEKVDLNLHAVNVSGKTAKILAKSDEIRALLDMEIENRQRGAVSVLRGMWWPRVCTDLFQNISKYI
eukprot:954148_1